MPENEPGWSFVVALADLWEGEMIGVRVGKAHVLVVNLGLDGVRAYDDRCPHAGSPLHDGTLRGRTLRCAAHLWEFDAQSGSGINPRTCQLRAYPVRVVGGAVMVRTEVDPGLRTGGARDRED
jgi:toluene monooxygenase system ferredoxin subunit